MDDKHENDYAYYSTMNDDESESEGCAVSGFWRIVIILGIIEFIWRQFH